MKIHNSQVIKSQITLFVLIPLLFLFCSKPKQQLIVFHAGSITNPINQIAKLYAKYNPEVEIKTEAGGSLYSIRKFTDLNRTCDLLIVSDYLLLNIFVDSQAADRIIIFATNSMTLAYTKQSKYADEINENNWHQILLKPEVKIGRSNPNQDPCGYRTELLFKLAEDYYDIPTLAEQFLNKAATTIRPKETDLLPLLQSGELDYIFIYRSNANQNRLKMIHLPDSINMGNMKLGSHYIQFSTKIQGRTPTDSIEIQGQFIAYGLIIPNNSPNYDLATDFVTFMFLQDSIWNANHQPLLPIPIVKDNR